jgi:hypothetical protein
MSATMMLGRFRDRLSRGTSSKRRRSARKNRLGLERLEDRHRCCSRFRIFLVLKRRPRAVKHLWKPIAFPLSARVVGYS